VLYANRAKGVFRTQWSATCASSRRETSGPGPATPRAADRRGGRARHLFEDRASGGRGYRAGLGKALAFIRPGECLAIWKLDRLGRSLPHLLTTLNELKTWGIAFRSLTEQMDTANPQEEPLDRRLVRVAPVGRAPTDIVADAMSFDLDPSIFRVGGGVSPSSSLAGSAKFGSPPGNSRNSRNDTARSRVKSAKSTQLSAPQIEAVNAIVGTSSSLRCRALPLRRSSARLD
jgi:hypothetical protein